ncbi:MAG: oligosaccharide flippase family protein [Chloroflexota bacterium]|nr:oligosaccharide flippase family protein [Chloroflexota bacterium]
MKSLFSASMLSLRINSFWLLFSRISVQALAVVFIALVARRLEPASFGRFTFIAVIIFIGNTFTSFGTDTLLIREIARAGQITTLVVRAFTLQLWLCIFWCFATLLFRAEAPLLIFSLSLFPLAIVSVVSALLRAFERMDLFWGLNIVNGLTQILAALFSKDLLTLCILLLIGNILAAFLALQIISVLSPDFHLFPFLDVRPIVPLVLPLAALTTLSVLSQRLGILSLSALLDETATGLFSAAARVVDAMKFGHYAILGALLPALSRRALRSSENYKMAFATLLGLSIFLAGAVTFFAHPIINMIFGAEYIPSVDLLTVIVWSLVPYTVSAFISVHLVVVGKEIILLKITIVSMAFSIFLFIWLIKQYGLPGAAWATLIGEIVQATIFILLQSRKVKRWSSSLRQ